MRSFLFILLTTVLIALILYFFISFKKSFYKKDKKLRIFLFKRRIMSIKNFEYLSDMITKDVLEALKAGNHMHVQAKALLPLILDARKTGEKLLSQQHFYHIILFPSGESRIRVKVERLLQIEKLLKSLPKQSLSFENLYEKL